MVCICLSRILSSVITSENFFSETVVVVFLKLSRYCQSTRANVVPGWADPLGTLSTSAVVGFVSKTKSYF